MTYLEKAHLLILQGEELCDEIHVFVTGGPKPKAHWKEIKEWHNEAFGLLLAIDPTLRESLKLLSVDHNPEEVFAVLRNDLQLLKAIQKSNAKPEQSTPVSRPIATGVVTFMIIGSALSGFY